MRACTKRFPLTFIDTQFMGGAALGLVALCPGPLDVDQQVECFKKALVSVPIYASRIAGKSQAELWLDFDPHAARVELQAPLAMLRDEISTQHLDMLAGLLPASIGGATALLTVTPLRDGFAVCFMGSHVAGDAYSLLSLFRGWVCAQLGRSLPERTRQRGDDLSAADLAAIAPALSESSARTSLPSQRGESMTLPAAVLRKLMEEINAPLHAAAFILLLRLHRERLFADGSAVRLRIPVDPRGLMRGLDRDFPGNAFVDAFVEVSRAELDHQPAVIAQRIRQAIEHAKRPDFLAQVLALGPHGLVPGPVWADRQGTFDFERDVIFSSLLGRWPGEVNLGQGPLTLMPIANLPRGFLLLPSRADDVHVEVRLSASRSRPV